MDCAFGSTHYLRSIADKLILTNVGYLAAGIYAFHCGQYTLSAIGFVTTYTSTMYHLHYESQYFNFDNIFAMVMMNSFIFTLWDCYDICPMLFNFGILALPVAGFLLHQCEMPSDIIHVKDHEFESIGSKADDDLGVSSLTPLQILQQLREKRKGVKYLICCIRQNRPLYDFFHCLWHLASALGPILCAWYLAEYKPESAMGGGYFDDTHYFPVVPVVCFGVSAAINVAGNVADIMPID